MWKIIDALRPDFARIIVTQARKARLEITKEEIDRRKLVVFEPELVTLLLD